MYKNSGFTMVEVLIAIFILSIAIMSWALTQQQNIHRRNLSGSMTNAVEIAQQVMEGVASSAEEWDSHHGDDSGNQTFTTNSINYSTSWNASSDKLLGEGKAIWHIQVEVQWNQMGNHEFNLERMVIGK